jgi:hypothetical protein
MDHTVLMALAHVCGLTLTPGEEAVLGSQFEGMLRGLQRLDEVAFGEAEPVTRFSPTPEETP